MFSFLKTKNVEVPGWASFFDKKEYNYFLASLKDYFDTKAVEITIGDGVLKTYPEFETFHDLGLVNVAQVCKQSNPKHYREIIKEHFDTFIKANKFDREFNIHIEDFDYVKEYIAVRIYPVEYFSAIGKELVLTREIGGDIVTTLVFDLPHTISSIKPEQAEKWKPNINDLFLIGIANIKEKYAVVITKEKVLTFSIWLIQGEHFFTPNIIFDFENHTNLIGSKGSLIGIPHRHTVIIYPIESLEVVEAINNLIPIIQRMYNEGPGSISDKLYWYHDTLFQDLPYKLENEKLQFYPPENFVQLLNTLQG